MADWTTDAVDTLENVVAAVRDKTVVPAQKATKVVVFGLLVYCVVRFRKRADGDDGREPPQVYGSNQVELAWTVIPVLIVVIMLAIAIFRVLVVLTGEVWAAYLILGGIFVLAGAFVWTLRSPRNEDANA